MIKLIIWGISEEYNKKVNLLKCLEETGRISVLGITSNDKGYSSMDGYRFIYKEELPALEFDFIVAMMKDSNSIFDEATKYGINRNKIVHWWQMDIPFFDFERLKNIRERRITVVSRNCFGGFLFHNLGLQFQSPFINLWLEEDDYIRLLTDFDEYMNMSVAFDSYGFDENMKKKYPVGRIGDIILHFNHYSNFDEAVEKWEERKKRINREDMLVLNFTEKKKYARMFCELNWEKKVIFTSFLYSHPNACFIPKETDNYSIDVNMYAGVFKPKLDLWNLLDGRNYERKNIL